LVEFRAFAYIDHQRCAADLGRLQRHLGEARDQFDGKIVHAVIAQILKSLKYGCFAGAAHSRDNDQFGSVRGVMRAGLLRFLSSARRFLALRGRGRFPRRHALDSSIEGGEYGRDARVPAYRPGYNIFRFV
jgi:hypothetical protein